MEQIFDVFLAVDAYREGYTGKVGMLMIDMLGVACNVFDFKERFVGPVHLLKRVN